MARFDPNTYPDRLAFEANARRIRAEEIDRIYVAVALSLNGWQHRFARLVSGYTHRHSAY